MEESQIYQNVADDHDRDRSPGVGDDLIEFASFNCKKNVTSLGLYELVKLSIAKGLAGGADKVFKDQKPINFKNRPSSSLRDNNKNFGICRVCCNECDNVSEQSVLSSVESSEDRFDDLMSKPSSKPGSYDGSALNFVAFLAILLTKSVGFQFSVMLSILTLPIWLSYCSFMFLMFPFQTLIRIRGFLMKMLWRMWSGSCANVTTFVGNRLIVPKSPVRLGMRLGRALFMSIYVCSVLFGLLVLGFVIGSFAMRQIAEEPIQTTETLHFDYTKSSPVAFVPVLSSSGDAVPFEQSGKPVRARFIPHNRKFQLTLSLTLPESDYNRKLGVFQVRMEILSANGKVTTTSTYPSMLRFKSQPILFVETFLKSAQLITGFKSESQILDIKMSEFIEGLEPTACFKVTLEQRAEFQSGAGIPEIYAALLVLESELPKFKRIVWNWRRTIFVWVSIMSFLTELMFVLAFFRPIIIPRSSPSIVSAKKYALPSTSSWYKCI